MIAPLEDPAFLDLYEPLTVLGRGGMGQVVRIRHRVWGHDLAAKVPLPNIVQDVGGLDRFRREADLWVDLPLHPNVVPCHYVRVFSNVPVIFTEYVPGGSLADAVRNNRFKGDVTAALTIAFDVASGLEHAHQRGLIHQDIKPSNILLQDGEAKITDFGIAKLTSDSQPQHMSMEEPETLITTTVGMTPLYASPEQLAVVATPLRRSAAITPATDLWSLGLTLMEMLLGPADEEPFWSPGSVPEATFARLPAEVVSLIRSLLSPEAKKRPSLEHITDELAALLASRKVYRSRPSTAELRADGLNNRGISAIDLGRLEHAEQQLVEALSIDPCHAEAVFNHTLLLWRSGRITDIAALDRVRQTLASSSSWEAGLLHAWIEIERGHEAGAWAVIDRVAEQGAGLPRATRSVARASRAVRDAVRPAASFQAHDGIADALYVSLDEHWVITGGRDGTVRLFELDSGHLVREFLGHKGFVFGVALSLDRKRLYSTSWDEKLRVFDVETGKLLAIAEHPGKLLRILVGRHRDGVNEYAVTTSHSGFLRLWSLDPEQNLRVAEDWLALPDEEDVNCVALSPDATYCVAGAGPTLHGFDWATGTSRFTREFTSRPRSVTFIAGRPDVVCVGMEDQRVLIVDVRAGQTLGELSGLHSAVDHVAVDHSGQWMVCSDGLVWTLWFLPEQRCIRTYSAPRLLTGVSFLRDSSLVTLDWGGSVRRYHLEKPARAPWMAAVPRLGRELATQRDRMRQTLREASEAWTADQTETALQALNRARSTAGFERDPDVLALAERLSTRLRRTQVRATWPLTSIPSVKASKGLLIDQLRQRLIAAAIDGSVHFHELPSGTRCKALHFAPEELLSRAMDLDAATGALAIGTYRRVSMFSPDGAISWRASVGRGYVRAVRFSPSGGTLAIARDDGLITIFDANNGSVLTEVHANETWLESVALWDEQRLATGDYHGTLLLWDLETARSGQVPEEITQPEPRKALLAHLETCSPSDPTRGAILQIRHRASCLYFASGDGSVRLLDIETGQELTAFRGHEGPVSGFDFLGDHHLVTVGFDKQLRIFECLNQKCIASYDGHTHPIWGVVAEDPHHVWTVSDDQVLRRLYIDWELAVK